MPVNPHGEWVCWNWEKVCYNFFAINEKNMHSRNWKYKIETSQLIEKYQLACLFRTDFSPYSTGIDSSTNLKILDEMYVLSSGILIKSFLGDQYLLKYLLSDKVHTKHQHTSLSLKLSFNIIQNTAQCPHIYSTIFNRLGFLKLFDNALRHGAKPFQDAYANPNRLHTITT